MACYVLQLANAIFTTQVFVESFFNACVAMSIIAIDATDGAAA